jgi:hypothetical protein
MSSNGTFTMLSTFDDASTARRAADALTKEGFPPQNIRVEPSVSAPAAALSTAESNGAPAPRHGSGRIERFFERLLGRTEHALSARDYSHAVGSGRTVVIVDTTSEVSAERAATVMQDFGAYDLTERRAVDTDHGQSTASVGEQALPDGTVVRWRAAHVVYRQHGEPLATLDGD